MKVGFYQFNPTFGRKQGNLERVASGVKDAELDLLVLPEFFATGYQFISRQEADALAENIPNGETTISLIELAQSKGIYIVGGLPERAHEKLFNSAIFVGPDGYIGTYRKTHLFYEEKLYFSPGDTGFKVWDTEIGRIGIMICFDWFFPESMRTLALRGADVIAHPSNLVLPYCPQSMPVRCLENRVYAVTANRTGEENRKEGESLRFIGQSQITAFDGGIIVRGDESAEELGIADIDVSKARNKSINPLNNLFKDRRPELYFDADIRRPR
ncbi:MAG: acyltransferase [Nitrospirae bacterium]|nr:acyltransferase [Nitrospirota bacterium]